MKTVTTFTATIYVGLKAGANPLRVHSADEARAVIQRFVDSRFHRPDLPGGCVTVTPTEFLYCNGSEPGLIVGFINYPRFPSTPALIRDAALMLAAQLRVAMEQSRVTVVFPDETVMLSTEPEGKS